VKRVAAAIIAIALVVAGFVINGRRTDPERGKAPLRLWCVKDAERACKALLSNEALRVTVNIGSPLEVDKEVLTESYDAIVTSAGWLDRLDNQARLKVAKPLASSPLVVAMRQDKAICVDMKCLANEDTRVAFPPADTLASSVAAAAVFAGRTADELPIQLVDYLRNGGARVADDDPLATLTSRRTIDGAVVIQAITKDTVVIVKPVKPTAMLQLELGYLTDNDNERLDTISVELRSQLLAQGWDGPVASLPGRAGAETVDAFTALNQ
jgi:Bacterial extracellular solute-binding protein